MSAAPKRRPVRQCARSAGAEMESRGVRASEGAGTTPLSQRLPEQAGGIRAVRRRGERREGGRTKAAPGRERVLDRACVERGVHPYGPARIAAHATERPGAASGGEVLAQEAAGGQRVRMPHDRLFDRLGRATLRRPSVAKFPVFTGAEWKARVERSCLEERLARAGDVVRSEEPARGASVEIFRDEIGKLLARLRIHAR